MNNIVLICSHLESNSDNLVYNLNSGSKFQKLNTTYNDVKCLTLNKPNFEYRKRPKVFFDHILYNYEFSCKELYKYINFIYVIGEPKKTLKNIVFKNIYDEKTAFNYYCFRLRRMYEMARRSKDPLILFDEDLKNPEIYDTIQNKLKIKDKLKIKIKNQKKQEIKIDRKIIEESENFYEKYRYRIKNLK